jgi:hypothetical protein
MNKKISISEIQQTQIKHHEYLQINYLPQDFTPFDLEKELQLDSDSITIPIASTNESIRISATTPIDWEYQFSNNPSSGTMWLLSLDFIGRLIATYEKYSLESLFHYAISSADQFILYAKHKDNSEKIKFIRSRDHSAAVRVKCFVRLIERIKNKDENRKNIYIKELDKWLQWLSSPDLHYNNNHGLMSATALLTGDYFLRGKHGELSKLGIDRIASIIEAAYDNNGMCNENTIGYHNYNILLYQKISDFLRIHDIHPKEKENIDYKIINAIKTTQRCIRQDQTIPPIGDSPVYKLKIPSINESFIWPDSGFAVIKNDDFYLSIQCGSRSEYHKQMDDSSITLRYKGIDILLDAGSYSYDRRTGLGRYMESSSGHSGFFPVQFDNLLRREVLSKYGKISGGITEFSANSNGAEITCSYQIPKLHAQIIRRIQIIIPNKVMITDKVICDSAYQKGMTSWVQRFLLGEFLCPSVINNSTVRFQTEKFYGELIFEPPIGIALFNGQMEPIPKGWHSVNFGEISPNSSIELSSFNEDLIFKTTINIFD